MGPFNCHAGNETDLIRVREDSRYSRDSSGCTRADKAPATRAHCCVAFEISLLAVNICPSLQKHGGSASIAEERDFEVFREFLKSFAAKSTV